ncbi:triosephosphate isomerase [Zoogloea ramigera]|uniref:Triosephosphate isomerase n=1 Tax=Zoogloea ramigera TaxID=350 RepID=A0A4Y4CRW0_ZOORA|nr:triosephosphate isomerase [Zoogloea ramigera]
MLSVRKKLVVGNWKMNGGQARNVALIDGLKGAIPEGVDVVVCPPYPYLAQVKALAGELGVGLGAQDLSEHSAGAFTGDVAAPMLRDVGCEWVLVGHSERRTLHGEGDQLVAAKISAALDAGLAPILCVGETLEERDGGRAEEVVSSQLASVVSQLGAVAMAGLVVAYEPVWAIGTGRTATPEQAELMHVCIRESLAGAGVAAGVVRILYGGSVTAANAAALFAKPNIDGALVGGASLVAENFSSICVAAAAS